MLKIIIETILVTVLFLIGVKIFSIVFWGTGVDMICDIIKIDEIGIEEVNDNGEKRGREL